MKLSTLTAQRENLKLEIAANVKSLANEIRAGKITRAEADKKIGELRSRKTMLDKKIALFNKPKGDEKRSGGARLTNADFIKAAAEKRSLTLAGNGAVNQVKEIIKAIINDDSLLNRFATITGQIQRQIFRYFLHVQQFRPDRRKELAESLTIRRRQWVLQPLNLLPSFRFFRLLWRR